MVAGINESETLTRHISCKCKCEFDGRNSNNKCRCKFKNMIFVKIIFAILLHVVPKIANIQEVLLKTQ